MIFALCALPFLGRSCRSFPSEREKSGVGLEFPWFAARLPPRELSQVCKWTMIPAQDDSIAVG
jgi:hypothetical protein